MAKFATSRPATMDELQAEIDRLHEGHARIYDENQRLRDESAKLREDAERLDWLERETHKSSYAVQFRLLRDPEISAGMNRVECTTTVGGGPWQRDVEGATLRAAIDAAMQKGE